MAIRSEASNILIDSDDCCEPPPPAGAVSSPDLETFAVMAKAIGHPARLTILRLLADRNACTTGDVVDELPLAQSTVSEHLRILREAGLIQGEIEGPRTRYCANPDGIAMLKAGIAEL
ncbi:MAG: metalloregulator ArsR/SmtB family transcription factor [Acidimicrobiales bacterium]|nr:metalloregulator ArsR/SmtB family transcription factor [Acidimicrobiales bacterium]